MDRNAQLECNTERLASAVKTFIQHDRGTRNEGSEPTTGTTNPTPDAHRELRKSKAMILSSLAAIRTLMLDPSDLLQHIATQVEILACLEWLAEFQILACIPPEGSVPIEDLADLAGVPAGQLGRIVRLMATTGFLRELEAGSVSHTPLSAHFIPGQGLLDATMFMAELVAPTALQMPSATQRFGASRSANETAYNLAHHTTRPFHAAQRERAKLSRQWSAYLSHAAGLHDEDDIVDVFSQLNWNNLGSASIVEVNAQSTSLAQALAKRFPNLHLVVQLGTNSANRIRPTERDRDRDRDLNMNDAHMQLEAGLLTSSSSSTGSSESMASSASSRISVTYRAAGMPQPVTDAAVYILHLPLSGVSTSPRSAPAGSLGSATARAELQDYLSVLHANGGIMLVLTTRLLPEPGSLASPDVEAVARARDLSMLQLANEGETEMSDLLAVIDSVKDSMGRLVVTNQLRSTNNLIIALALKYQTYA
ncbi:hypothetical protein B0T22DRAFT_473259 [Podospora appendiculata]|uniref:O-methyltransferase n=1 Tax=Podospora appendiculata TaxID=314037 RepID=A0AAE1C7B1_9PEZI|nr:hypothetical protein B0T22DRAFT_474538 [Podospora appendiculata]KAK3681356.1 hypothetical protein B0T22DRAFT_473259 [Podospora appendiculata]